jgi:ATP-grasp domain-containing protein
LTIYLTARNPTMSVSDGLLPAATRLGYDVVVLTDQPGEHTAAYGAAHRDGVPHAVVPTEVFDPGAVAAQVGRLAGRFGRPDALLSNSDHLQAATALAAELLGLPAKPWAAAARCKNKLLMRQTLAAAGLDTVAAEALGPDDAVPEVPRVPFPLVVKPREGVASEDVVLVEGPAELRTAVAGIRRRRPGATLLLEEYVPGPLYTYDTLGDGAVRHPLGTWRTTLDDPPHFVERRMEWAPEVRDAVRAGVEAQLDALGVGLGACHTEFVLDRGVPRIIEVNYRLVGDAVDLCCAELLEIDLFAEVVRAHLGEPVAPDPARTAAHARIDWVVATTPGTLTAAPADGESVSDERARVVHRLVRPLGSTQDLRHNNRDYVAAVYGVGGARAAVDEAVEEYLSRSTWRITAAAGVAAAP